jgi:biotin carboxyl carrier protein
VPVEPSGGSAAVRVGFFAGLTAQACARYRDAMPEDWESGQGAFESQSAAADEATGGIVEIDVPAMGEGVTEVAVLEWHKRVGDMVHEDETIVEISTDKVDAEIPAPASGTLIDILAEAGTTVPVGHTIARLQIRRSDEAPSEPPRPRVPARGERPIHLERSAATPRPTAATLTRFYEAHRTDFPRTPAAVRILSLPQPVAILAESLVAEAWGWPDVSSRAALEKAVVELGLASFTPVAHQDLLNAIAATQQRDNLADMGEDVSPTAYLSAGRRALSRSRRLQDFTAHVAVEPVVPIEMSPLGGTSLATLAKSAGASVALGVAAYTNDPILLLYVPAGMVLVGAASGISRALEQGLYARVLRWLTHEESEGDPRPTETESPDETGGSP